MGINGNGWDQDTQPVARATDSLPSTGELKPNPTAEWDKANLKVKPVREAKARLSSEDEKLEYMARQRRRREFINKCEVVQKGATTAAIVWVSIAVIVIVTWLMMFLYGGGVQ